MSEEEKINLQPNGCKRVKNSKMWQLVGDKTVEIINELNEVLAA